ncbi:MAG: hypothetical protein VB061_07860 [Christensenella sp.]|nr:hypothetical protein [Christensenella sp.]
MRSHIQCGVCGYIGEDSKIKQTCPACGAPLSSFEHYEYGINEKRLSNLSLHLHPILVHFPTSIAVLSFIFLLIAFFMGSGANNQWILIEKIISIILPFSIIAAMAAGLFDAKSRLRDVIGRLQKQKIKLGTFFLVVSCISAILINYEVFTFLGRAFILLLALLGIIFSAVLGKKGASLLSVLIKDPS